MSLSQSRYRLEILVQFQFLLLLIRIHFQFYLIQIRIRIQFYQIRIQFHQNRIWILQFQIQVLWIVWMWVLRMLGYQYFAEVHLFQLYNLYWLHIFDNNRKIIIRNFHTLHNVINSVASWTRPRFIIRYINYFIISIIFAIIL